MADPQVKVDNLTLDNGTWRHIIGNPAVLADPSGRVREFHVEFLIEGDTSTERRTRFDSTFEDFYLLNPRLRVWFDASEALPTLDWYVGDGKVFECVTAVTMLPEESQTQGKLHCLFSFVASTQPDFSEIVPTADGIEELAGLKSNIEVSKLFMESEKYTLSAKGVFVATQNDAVEGPYSILSVTNNGGFARITLKTPDAITETFATGQYIDIDSTSAYEGRHFISALSTGNTIIDTTTEFVSLEGDIGATLTFGNTTSAEANFAAAKNTILTTILETGTGGGPNSAWPHMTKLGETLVFASDKKDQLEFVLVAGPQALRAALLDDSGNLVERGLSYNVRYVPAENQDTSFAPLLWDVIIDGKCAITDPDRDKSLEEWYDIIKNAVVGEVSSVVNARLGGNLRVRQAQFGADYTTNDITFQIACFGNYNGTIAFNRQESFSTKQPRTIWRNTDGANPTQSPKGPPDKVATIKIDWIGEQGGGPGEPPPPTESGFQYLFDTQNVSFQRDLTDADGNRYEMKTVEFRYIRVKPVSGGGGGAGSSGGQFNDSGYFVPTSPDI